MTDIIEIKNRLNGQVLSVCQHLFSAGRKEGNFFSVGSINGEKGDSLKVYLSGAKQGQWQDYAIGDEGGDLIDLWMAVRNISRLPDALDEIKSFMGIADVRFAERQKKTYRRPERPTCATPRKLVREYLLGERCLTPESIAAYSVAERDKDIVFPGLVDGKLVFVKYIPIDRHTSGRSPSAEGGCEPILLGWQAIPDDAREVVICEGEIDALSCWDYGFPALSVPFGAGGGGKQQWIESEFDRLARFETIYLIFDPDEPGDQAIEAIVPRLGRHRCRVVKLPYKDPNECRQKSLSKEDFAKCLWSAKTNDPEELRPASDFLDEVIETFYPPEGKDPGYHPPWQKLKGKLLFRPDEMTIWHGLTGHGKTELLSHLSVDLISQSAKVCVLSLEMKPKLLQNRMVKQASGTGQPTVEFIREIFGWFDDQFWIVDILGVRGIQRILEVFEYARCRYGCDVFIIDSFMRLGIPLDDNNAQNDGVRELLNWVTTSGSHLHLVAHSKKSLEGVPDSEDVKGAGEIAAQVFNVIGAWRNKKLERKIEKLEEELAGGMPVEEALREAKETPGVILNVSKNRNGEWEGTCGLWFDRASHRFRSSHDRDFNYIRMRQTDAA